MRKTLLPLLAALFVGGFAKGQLPPTATPAARELSVVDQKLVEAREYLEFGLYEAADKRCRQVLALDPDNEAATQGRELVRQARKEFASINAGSAADAYSVSYPETYWQLPCDTDETLARIKRAKGVGAMQNRLAGIMLPRTSFVGMPLHEAVARLQQVTRLSDTDHDPALSEVEIRTEIIPEPARGVSEETVPIIPELPLGASPEVEPAGFVRPVPTTENKPITLELQQGTLLSALHELAISARMTLKIKADRVTLVSGNSGPYDIMRTLSIHLPPSLFTDASGNVITTSDDNHQAAKAFLEASGVQFPPGAGAIYLAQSGTLIVRNTQANLDIVQVLFISCCCGPPPDSNTPAPTPTP